MARLTPGLVSVSFDALPTSRVLELAVSAGLSAIEWSARSHVPNGSFDVARELGQATRGSGLEVANYGSYLRLGEAGCEEQAWRPVLDTAVTLGAPAVRVWAGARSSSKADSEYRHAVTTGMRRFADAAAARGMGVVIEHHAHTLTDDTESALTLIADVDRPNVRLSWQPPNPLNFAGRLADLRAVRDVSADVHAFHWSLDTQGDVIRHRLIEGESDWRGYLGALAAGTNDRRVLLEFVPNDDPELLHDEAELLRAWIAEAHTGSEAPR